jgi:hypothetical protein
MVRDRLLLIAVTAVLVSVQPAAAQFGTIFGGPPRPPGDIPQSGPPSGDDRYYSAQPQQRWTREPRVVAPPPQGYPPPYPQQQGYPQQGYPQQGYPDQQAARPPSGGYQQQELPPPPGATAAPPPPGQQPAALPGLPPGQRQPRGQPGDTPAAPAAPAPPNDEVVIAPPAQKIPNTTAVFSGLDKITGRIISFDVALNETVQFGALQVTPRVCYTRPATEASNTDGFIEVDEITLQGEIKRIFSGWMFAASPGLHAVEHPIYDVWLADCKGPQQPAVAAIEPAPAPAPPPQKQAPRPQQARPKQLPPPGALPPPSVLPPPAAQQLSPQPLVR